jgi:YVTN family beta-propeller protein
VWEDKDMKGHQCTVGVFLLFFFATFSLAFSPLRALADTVILGGINVGASPTYLVATSTMLYVSNSGDNTITAINTTNNATSSISISQSPSIIAALGKYIFVGSSVQGEYVIDTTNNNSVITGGTGGSPITGFAVIGTKMFASDYSLNQVQFNDIANGLSGISINVGTNPRGLAASSTMLYVANSGSTSVTFINTANSYATTTVNLGSGASTPWSILPLGTKLYVTDEGTSTVSIIDLANGNATSTVTVGTSPTSMVTIGGKIYVANGGTAVSVIDTNNSNAVSSINIGQSMTDIYALNGKIYTSSGSSQSVKIIDTVNGNVVSTVTPSSGNGSDYFAAIGSHLYVTSNDNKVHEIDTNTIPAILTQLTPIPSTVSTSTVTYSYTASYPIGEQEALHIGGDCTSGVQVQASQVGNGATSTIQISNLTTGTTYNCTTYLIDTNGTQSNTLAIGPFTYTAPVVTITQTTGSNSNGGGTSITSQVANLIAMGKTETAQAIEAQWPHLFGPPSQIASSTIQTSTNTPRYLFTKNFAYGMSSPDVLALQKFLNSHGFTLAVSGIGSPGKETNEFGVHTRAALSKYQASVGIVPAAGYLGPLTRVSIGK